MERMIDETFEDYKLRRLTSVKIPDTIPVKYKKVLVNGTYVKPTVG